MAPPRPPYVRPWPCFASRAWPPPQSKGVFVRRRLDRVELDATSEIIAEGDGRGGVARLLEASYTIPSEQVATLLQLTDAAEEAWTRRFLISTVDDQPLHLATSYFAGSLAKGTPSASIWS